MATNVPVSEGQAAISPFGRVMGVFFSPKATFEDIVRKPSWIVPAILLTVFSFAVCVGINQRVNWRQYIGAQIEKNPDTANMSAEQKEQRLEGGVKFALSQEARLEAGEPIAHRERPGVHRRGGLSQCRARTGARPKTRSPPSGSPRSLRPSGRRRTVRRFEL